MQTEFYIFTTIVGFLFAYVRENVYLCTRKSLIGMKIKSFLGVLILSTIALSQSSVYAQAQQIQMLNALIASYAHEQNILYVDYYSAMVDTDGGLKKGLSDDEVHPNHAGYQIMEPIILNALGRYHDPTKILKESL